MRLVETEGDWNVLKEALRKTGRDLGRLVATEGDGRD